MSDDSTRLLRTNALARALSVGPDKIRAMWRDGELPFVEIHKGERTTRATSRADLQEFLERRRQSSAAIPSH